MSKLVWWFLLLGVLAGPAFAETGRAVAVITDARATSAGTTRVLNAGSDLAIGETVATDTQGQVQILFSDNTELVVGPNSSLVLEDYLVRGDGSVGKLAINALSGTFRFVTGGSPKEDYSIKTPGGTIGIRGTAFDFFIVDGVTYVIMYHGSALLCGGGSCAEVSESCQIGTSDGRSAQVIGLSMDASQGERDSFRAGFRYADNQSPLEIGFRIDEVPSCQLVGPAKLTPQTIADVVGLCSPVVGEQYAGKEDRWGECGAAVAGFVGSLDPTAPETSQTFADLVTALAELFQPGSNCSEYPTELPDAIKVAARSVVDQEQREQILELAATIEDCQAIRTASTQPQAASPI